MAIAAVLLIAINIVSYSFINTYWIKFAILVVTIILFFLIIQFFRNPKRNTVLNDAHVVAPVDGKVVAIEEVEEKEY